jgi:hypothetical protein
VAVGLIVEHIRSLLQQPELSRIFPNLQIIPSNFQIQGMHTILRSRETSKEDFVSAAAAPDAAGVLLGRSMRRWGLWRVVGQARWDRPHLNHLPSPLKANCRVPCLCAWCSLAARSSMRTG